MPLLHVFDTDPGRDGRQSDRAMMVRRGTMRLLREMGFAAVPEVTLPSGRRADLVALAGDGAIAIIEVKSSVADLRADGKWQDYRRYCDRFWFATCPEVVPHLPAGEGVIVSDGFDADVITDAPFARMSAATRRAVTLRVAQTAARRLHLFDDPGARL
ncbi:MAG: MmcB family DNA repair protein [Pseudomonadota bacterium]